MSFNINERQRVVRRQRRRRQHHRDGGWPLVSLGALSVLGVSAISLSSDLRALPVMLPLMMLPIPLPLMGAELPVIGFLVYNFATLGRKIDRVPDYAPGIAGVITALIGCLSLGYYAVSWKYRDVYQPSSTVDTWAVFNCLLAVATVALWIRAMRHRTVERLVFCHITMFVWFYSFAFPWLGESI